MSDVPDLQELLTELNEAIEESGQHPDAALPIQTIERLLQEHPELAGMMSDWDGLGQYPLHHAAFYGCVLALEALIAAGAEVNALTNNHLRQTALHLAAQQDEAWAVATLAEAGANLTQRDAAGLTPLVTAIHSRHAAAIGQLLMQGAPLDLRAAVNFRQPAVVRLILRDNPGLVHDEPDAADLVPETVIWGKGNTDVLRLILEAGANPNTCGQMGPPLYLALGHNDRAATELLLAYGADPDKEIRRGVPTGRAQTEGAGQEWALGLFSSIKGNK